METLKNNLPLLSVGLLILGTINMLIFYSYFNIDILSYLDFTEVLQIQFKLFAISSAIFIGVVLTMTVFSLFSEERSNSFEESAFKKFRMEEKRKKLLESKNIVIPAEEEDALIKIAKVKEKLYYNKLYEAKSKKKKSLFTKFKLEMFIFPFMVALGLSSLSNHISMKNMYGIHLISIPLFVLFTLLAYFGIRKDSVFAPTEFEELQKRRDLYKIICLFIILAYSGGSYARASAIDLVIRKSDYEVTLTMEKKSIATSKYYRYIGKTKNYLFFYNIVNKQSDVFKIDQVKSLSIKDGVKYD